MSQRLFFILVKPYSRVYSATVFRWIKNVMGKSGIDISVFKPHSTRNASVSKGASLVIPTDVILSRADSKSGNCFGQVLP